MRPIGPRPVRRAESRPRRFVLLAVLLGCLSLPGLSQQQLAAPRPSNAADEVRLTVTVADKEGRLIAGLGRDDFAVIDERTGTPREISFFGGGDEPLSVVFAIDVSSSMSKTAIVNAKHVAGRFVLMSNPQNEYSILEFGGKSRGVTEWVSERGQIDEGLRRVGLTRGDKDLPAGTTAVYDACASALATLAGARRAKRVVFLITDGQDNNSRTTFEELKRGVRGSDALIYAVGFVERGLPASLDVAAHHQLDVLTATSGGRVFFAETLQEAVGSAERIAGELRHQYIVGFSPGEAEAGEGKWRKIKIKVTPLSKKTGRITVRSREGYFFPRAKP